MKKLLIYWGLACISDNTDAQRVIDVDKETGNASVFNYVYTVAGTPFVSAKFLRVVEGSPFFNEQMMKGAIILSEGKEYRNIMVRINLLESQVNYIGDKQIEMVASTPIREVVVWDTINNKDHSFIYSTYIEAVEKPEKGFYELLQAGQAQLYKRHKKQLLESKPYGSATIEQRIQTEITYFILKDKQWRRVKKVRDLTALLNDKTKDIAKFISDNKINGDSQANFESVIAHYNSLFNQ
ncbi:MAG TPA: hypothetical protein VFP97_02830 [Chitinophagaceae bacterium]|nr:hypothetical protein [Chitinophagaceae bacterium]